MRLTKCDRCGEDCTSRIALLHLRVEHYTSNHEQVAEDEFAPPDLCGRCADDLRQWFGALGRPWPRVRHGRSKDMSVAMEEPLPG